MTFSRTFICAAMAVFATTLARADDTLLPRARQVLAQLEGDVRLPVKQPVEILRDRWGVAHIYAKNADDLFFAQGWVAAQDRLFQIDLWRRTGVGELAEVLGESALEGDRFARLIQYRGDMDKEWTSYSPDTKAIAIAFANGINAYIDHLGDKKLPIEFQLLGHKPKKWKPEDILGRMSGIIMSRNFSNELARAQLIAAVGLEKARILAPTDPPRNFQLAAGIDPKIFDAKILQGFKAATKEFRPTQSTSESNNWVVDGTLSASGKPMLASDPHRTIAVPSLRYLVHLNAPGWNVIGAGEPGLPGIALGHNERIAWGITIIGTDQADFYVEQLNPQSADEYKTPDGWEKIKTIRDAIPVKGIGLRDVELSYTRHGPILHRTAQHAFALKWAGSEPGGAAYLNALAVSRAKNKEEFLKEIARWKIPSLNFAYADVDGNIGWVAAAATPVRKGWDGLLPVPGWAGFEWQRFLDVKELPQSFNPARHWIATANHNILPAGYPHEIGYEFSPGHRYRRIEQRLSAKKSFTLEDFQSIQHEATSLPGQTMANLLKKVDVPGAKWAAFVELMTSWDGVLSRDAQAGPLYAVWLQELTKGFYGPHRPAGSGSVSDGGPLKAMENIDAMLQQLEKPSSGWFGKNPEEGRDELLRTSFILAVERTKSLLGNDPRQWKWGTLHTANFKHPLSNFSKDCERAFNLGSVPRTGDANTPNNTKHDEKFQQVHGASYRQVFDLADWDNGLATSTPGQSGQPGSVHYGDLLPLWAEGKYFPLYYSRKKVEESTTHRMTLKP